MGYTHWDGSRMAFKFVGHPLICGTTRSTQFFVPQRMRDIPIETRRRFCVYRAVESMAEV